jgi:uncharacterized protein GlcG (DUF336 family)
MSKLKVIAAIGLALFFSACSSGSDSSSGDNCDGFCAHQALSIDDVKLIVRQAVGAAEQLGVNATLAVLDRAGNVLAVYSMPGAQAETTISSGILDATGLEGAVVPVSLAAISKAGTAAYLSSQGNAFSTRTASQIIQEHFNPGELGQPGGPLSGVQFSQLPCSDTTRSGLGPRALPLGLSADAGGFPLYKQGDLVGGIGVEFDGQYGVDRNVQDRDFNHEEYIALSATLGFESDTEIRAERIFVAGRSLRFSDLNYGELATLVEPLPELQPSAFKAMPFFGFQEIRAGTRFGDSSSGILTTVRAAVSSESLVDINAQSRYPTRNGSALAAGIELKIAEVDALLDSALITASRMRAAIRRPLDSAARVNIWVVDSKGEPLGFTRSKDAPLFGVDVALQKARTAAFFSSTDFSTELTRLGFADYLSAFNQAINFNFNAAFSARSIGNLSRLFFPDGIDSNSVGPFTRSNWSPFNTGLQLDLILPGIVAPLLKPALPTKCSQVQGQRLQNGMQIFPGAVPLYRNGILVGAIGVSGDGIDQDDMVAFYGASRTGLDYATHFSIGDQSIGFNAPMQLRSDNLDLKLQNTRLRYVSCPESPFIDGNDQNVCAGF